MFSCDISELTKKIATVESSKPSGEDDAEKNKKIQVLHSPVSCLYVEIWSEVDFLLHYTNLITISDLVFVISPPHALSQSLCVVTLGLFLDTYGN